MIGGQVYDVSADGQRFLIKTETAVDCADHSCGQRVFMFSSALSVPRSCRRADSPGIAAISFAVKNAAVQEDTSLPNLGDRTIQLST
jgi:hypothetical protein